MLFKLLQVKKLPIYDVFYGEGWENWTRVLLKKDHVIYLSGNKLNAEHYNRITKYIRHKSNNDGDKKESNI